MPWDYSRCAVTHYNNYNNDRIVEHFGRPPFESPQVRVNHWWRIQDPDIYLEPFYKEHNLSLVPEFTEQPRLP